MHLNLSTAALDVDSIALRLTASRYTLMILTDGEKTFVIGDNLNTDIRGANNLKLDSLFITSGIHRTEFKEDDELNCLLKKYKVSSKYFQKSLNW